MMPDPESTDAGDPQELRRAAEEKAAERLTDSQLPPVERLPKLVHELQVHQIELEMQNAALRRARAELEVSRDRYADLYDFSPVGYVTLDARGIIREINLTACGMLGRQRSRLVGYRFLSHVADRGKNLFAEFLGRCRRLGEGEEAAVEVRLRNAADKTETPVQICALAVPDPQSGEPQSRMAMIDVRRQAEAETRLRELNERLEEEVRERTAALAVLRDVASMANRAQNVEEALEYCLRRVAEHNGWSFGHVFLPAADNPDLLLPAYAWYAADIQRFGAFRELTLGTTFRRGECLAGRVYASGEPGWSTDIFGEMGARRGKLAGDVGLCTMAAFPVIVEHRVVAVLEFFSDKTLEPDEGVLESMAGVGLQLGRVIERKAFQDRLLTLAEEEHRRIGQELHDDVGQELTGLALKTETLAEILGEEPCPAGDLAREIVAAVERTRRKTRALSRGLVPTEIDAPGLETALEGLALEVNQGKGSSCRFHARGQGRVSDGRIATQLYRIAQEAVANALRHSGAERLEIGLTNDKGGTVLEIRDDGRGLPPAEQRGPGLGLQIMRYRAGMVGGTLSVEPDPEGGTRVKCRVPRKRP